MARPFILMVFITLQVTIKNVNLYHLSMILVVHVDIARGFLYIKFKFAIMII